MKILILPKAKQVLLNGKIEKTEDYIEKEHFFEGIARGFKDLGHEVSFDGREFSLIPLSVAYKLPRLYKYLCAIVNKTGLRLIDRILISKSIENKVKDDNIDVIFTEINDSLTISSIEKMKKMGAVVTEWFGIFPQMTTKMHLKTLNHFSHVWCPGNINEEFRKYGVTNKNIHYIPSSFNEKFYFHEYDEKYAYDVCFVGGITKPHSNRIEVLEKVAQKFEGFAFYGYGIANIRRNSILRKLYKGWADFRIMRKLYSSSKIAINLTLDRYDKVKRGVNARCFEIPSCKGALQVSFYNANINEFFNDTEIVYFKSTDELIDKIEYFLSNEKKRTKIVIKAFEKNKSNVTSNRVKRILEYLS